MAFRNGNYATIWGVVPKENVCQVQLRTSRKDKTTGEYVTDFSDNFVLFSGKAGEKAQSLEPGTRIQIKECSVTTRYVKEKKVKYWNCYVYDFDVINATQVRDTAPVNNNDETDDDMPF